MSLPPSGGFRSRARGGAGSRRTQAPRTPSARTKVVSHSRDAATVGRRKHRQGRTTVRASEVGVDAARAAVVETIIAVRIDGAYANLALPAALENRRLSGRDAAFATEMTYGTLRRRGVLDAIITHVAQRPIKDMTPEVLSILELGAYQLLYTRVEDHASVDTSVRLTRGVGFPNATGFVNATLRAISRRSQEEWEEELAPATGVARIAFLHSHPTWIARSFAQHLEDSELAEALAVDSQRPVVHMAARPDALTNDELAAVVGGELAQYSPYGVYLRGGDPSDCAPVRQHLAVVQDEGSQLIARALVQAEVCGTDGGEWMDLCAGPGGKTLIIGALAAQCGAHVEAVEKAPHRADLVREACADLPVSVRCADGRDVPPGYGCDRILVDAPCSGLGALRRRPEARWTKSEDDIAALAQLQRELLGAALTAVRPGGVVIYSTCSPDQRETRDVVDATLTQHPDVEELPAADLVPGMENTGEYPSVQMWPHRHGTDAMFFAVLRRKTSGSAF